MEPHIYGVTEVNQLVKGLLDSAPALQGVAVRGELSNYKIYPSGHHYFTLKDQEGALRCVMFRGQASRLRFRPENGMKAVADYVHSKGLKFGMYSCAGVRTCAGYPSSFDHEFVDAATFADLAGDPLEYRAMALKDMGVYGGRQIAGQLCFAPDETVSRGEFLVMAMRVLGMEPDAAVLTSGFADEAATAAWMRPYITAAYRSGVISGVSAETGMEFRPNAALTKAECAVMLQNMLDLPQPDTQPVFSVEEGECIASWAVPSASALQSAGLELTPLADGTLTRRECAELLYQLSTLCQQDVLENFRWDS